MSIKWIGKCNGKTFKGSKDVNNSVGHFGWKGLPVIKYSHPFFYQNF